MGHGTNDALRHECAACTFVPMIARERKKAVDAFQLVAYTNQEFEAIVLSMASKSVPCGMTNLHRPPLPANGELEAISVPVVVAKCADGCAGRVHETTICLASLVRTGWPSPRGSITQGGIPCVQASGSLETALS